MPASGDGGGNLASRELSRGCVGGPQGREISPAAPSFPKLGGRRPLTRPVWPGPAPRIGVRGLGKRPGRVWFQGRGKKTAGETRAGGTASVCPRAQAGKENRRTSGEGPESP